MECIDFFEVSRAIDKPEKITIAPALLQAYCADCLGYYNYVDYAGTYSLVRITGGCVVGEASVQDLKHAIREDLRNRGVNSKVWEAMAARNFLTEHCLHLLPKLEEVNFHPSTADTAYFYYSNRVVKVDGEGISMLSYTDFSTQYGAYLWKAQANRRGFAIPEQGFEDGQFYRFLNCICNHDAERLHSLMSIIGYLLHPYKDPANTKAIILLDEKTDFSGEAHGGTGKSLIGRAIQEVVSTVWRDGKNYNSRETFATDDIKPYTRLIVYDDVKRGFNFEELYAMITGDMPVKRKYKDSTTIPFRQSPKILISSNSMVKGTGGSADERRRVEFEVAPYFNLDRTPIAEFGNRLFEEWDTSEWNKFDVLMMHCMQHFIRHGLVRPAPINLIDNRLKLATHPEFVDFMDARIIEAQRFDKGLLLAEFQKLMPSQRQLSAIAFKSWIDKWTTARGYTTSHFKSNGKAIVVIDTGSVEEPNAETENHQNQQDNEVEGN